MGRWECSSNPVLLGAMTSDLGRVWVSHVWRDWTMDGGSEGSPDRARAARPYEHWDFARELAWTPGINDVRRGVVMQKLWNAVDLRLQHLRDIYGLKQLARQAQWPASDGEGLKTLERLGLLRPLILRELKAVRDAVEHEDDAHPDAEACRNYVDLVWYFLRSTDIFVSRPWDDVIRVLEDEVHAGDQVEFGKYHVTLTYDTSTWRIRLWGRLRPEDVSTSPVAQALPMLLDKPLRHEAGLVQVSGEFRASGEPFVGLVQEYFGLNLL